jgi:hypothetical protein
MVAFAVALVATAAASAQQQKEPAAPSAREALLQKLATPGEHHQRLDALAGQWKLAVKWRNTPDAPWAESKGEAE